jgi:dipeptidyl-peptidase 4
MPSDKDHGMRLGYGLLLILVSLQVSAAPIYRDKIDIQWLPDGKQGWYRVATAADTAEYILFDAETGKKQPLFDAAAAQQALGADAAKATVLQVSGDGQTVILQTGDKYWQKLPDGQFLVSTAEEIQKNQTTHPPIEPSENGGSETEVRVRNPLKTPVELFWVDRTGDWQSFGKIPPGETRVQHTYAGHVWVLALEDRRPVGVVKATEQGSDLWADDKRKPAADAPPQRQANGESQPVESPPGVRAEIRDHNVYLHADGKELPLTTDGTAEDGYADPALLSPDGKFIGCLRVKRAPVRTLSIVDSSPKDQLQPNLKQIPYQKPGDVRDETRVCLFAVADQKPVAIEDTALENPWSIEDLQWRADSSELFGLYNQRGHQCIKFFAVQARTGKVRSVVEERSPTFIDYTNKVYYRILADTQEVLWMSERDGYCHLYLYSLDGTLKRQLTQGKWMVRKVEEVLEKERTVLVCTMGFHPGQDPYYMHLARVHLDTGALTPLTQGDGTHTCKFSPNNRWFIARHSRVDLPAVTEIRRVQDGTLALELERGDASALLKTGWTYPERFVAKARDGLTDIHGIIVRPKNFQPGKKYPVIEGIYAGPHDFFTPKSFSTGSEAHPFTDHGFIWVQLDGMGTNWRGKAFHDVCYKNLHDSGFPDRKLWLRAAAAKYPEFDLTRVGIYGGSAGGQSAMRALIDHHDLYKAAAADCGCHDNRMDKIWWNEQWMGWPIDDSYKLSSNTEHAHRLKGNFLITWGELDTNVDPASSMQVVHALIKADKDFEMLIIPGGGHGVGESSYAARKRLEFFQKHLKP